MKIAEILSWNIWQMDGLKDTVPHGKPYEEFCQMTIFDMLSDTVNAQALSYFSDFADTVCKIKPEPLCKPAKFTIKPEHYCQLMNVKYGVHFKCIRYGSKIKGLRKGLLIYV